MEQEQPTQILITTAEPPREPSSTESPRVAHTKNVSFIEPSTPFEVIHEDLEMYRAIVDAFKLLSSKQERKSVIKMEIERDSAQKHMKRLSLIACGFDEKLVSAALQEKHYDIDAAFEYLQKSHDGPVSPLPSPIVREDKSDT